MLFQVEIWVGLTVPTVTKSANKMIFTAAIAITPVTAGFNVENAAFTPLRSANLLKNFPIIKMQIMDGATSPSVVMIPPPGP